MTPNNAASRRTGPGPAQACLPGSQGPALAPRPPGRGLRPPVHCPAGRRESGVRRPPIRAGSAGCPTGLARRSSSGDRRRPGQERGQPEGRLGFQRLLAEVGLDHVGLILGLEMSRLARSCKDWHQLLESVRPVSHAVGRSGRAVRPDGPQRQTLARADRNYVGSRASRAAEPDAARAAQ